ncbi:MAG: VCBS repeat-containing protein [Deltaproteobacteria bacterium]|jgi:hypothetical protein|nr:VCBS repeat-containing protein [Deltaproteobacteria bacterium]MBW2530934.1 VCBS repeat-containing protein [Deltaproteobacteria bacterium]
MRASLIVIGWLLGTGALLASCGDDDEQTTPTTSSSGGGHTGGQGGAAGAGGDSLAPGADFDRFCGASQWDETLTAAAVGDLSGEYLGALADPPPTGTLCTMKLIPEHPFYATTIRVAFVTGGAARLRLMTTFGRSYPGGWEGFPFWEDEAANLIEPIDLDVPDEPDPEEWIEIDIAAAGVFLEPTQHYMLVYEHLDGDPRLAVEGVDSSPRGQMLVPGQSVPSGFADAQWRMDLAGHYFCAWEEPERWFGAGPALPDDAASTVAIADLDADGHDDLVLYSGGGPRAYLGDGAGAFHEPGFDPFPDTPKASFLAFGDLDNDGDRDAFAAINQSPDHDGDGVTLADGDCNNADANVFPGATEADNGFDDDCDGIADDGTDGTDADQDGFAIAAGDCDDTRDDVYPGATELLDRRDNDCDLSVDENFFHHILENDGQGVFTRVSAAGVEAQEPCASGALGDGDGDGFLDVYWGNWLEKYPNPASVSDRFATGNGDLTFTDALQAAGMDLATARPAYGVKWNDFNDDGHADVFVGNYGYGRNLLWAGQGNGTFVDLGDQTGVDRDEVGTEGGNSFGGDFGDLDNDGDVDLYLCNIAHPRYQPLSDISMLLINQGGPDYGFVDQRAELGLIYDEGDINAAFGDFDNDMDLDLVVGSTYPNHYSRLYRNDGDGGFTDVTYETASAIHQGASVTWSDVDEDGDLDLVAAGSGRAHVLINRVGQEQSWVQLDLRGTTSNRDAIGARVTLEAGGVTQLRDLFDSGGNTNPQRSRIVHFGLGSSGSVDAVTVRWPTGTSETISGVAPNGRYRVVEGTGQATLIAP